MSTQAPTHRPSYTLSLVDREGKVRYVHHGYKPGYEDKYLDQIRSLLRE